MEMKAIADGDTGCIMALEMHEGKVNQAHKCICATTVLCTGYLWFNGNCHCR